MQTSNDVSTHSMRRAVRWSQWMSGIALFLLFLTGIYSSLRSVASNVRELRISQDKTGELHLSSASDGPFVITHLAVYGGNEGDKRVAPLIPAMAIIDSSGAEITREQITKLHWRDHLGNDAEAPSVHTKIRVLYSRPQVPAIATD